MCSSKNYALLLILPMLLMALVIDGEEGKQEELKIRNDPSSTASEQQKQPELAMPATDPSGKKNPDENNPDLNPNLKDSDENNLDATNDPDKKDSKETKVTKQTKDSHETDEKFDLDGNQHGDQAGVGQDQEPVKATEDPSKPTFKKILAQEANAKVDMPFCKFEFAEYTGEIFEPAERIKPASMRLELLTSNTTFVDLKKWHLDAKEDNISGSQINSNEEALVKESVPAEIFEPNMDLMMGGAKEMVKIFTRWAEQGPELLKLIHLGDSSAKFTVDAGLTNSQVRLARNIYCVKKLALNLQTKLRSENVSPLGQSVAGKGKMEVHFAIPIVWIAHESVAKMEQVTKVSNALKDAVNEPHEVTDGPDADKVVDMTRVIESRKLMATVIKTLANGEDEVTSNKEFAQIGRGSKKGSSMALMGIIFTHECKSAECVQFFHVYSDDEIYETSEENYEEYW